MAKKKVQAVSFEDLKALVVNEAETKWECINPRTN